MQSWLQEWYGISYEPQMKPGDMQQMEKLAVTSGEEFEIVFMEMRIKHHEKAIKQTTQCAERAYHDALVDMCEDIITTCSVCPSKLCRKRNTGLSVLLYDDCWFFLPHMLSSIQ
jgi:hypothetical protein